MIVISDSALCCGCSACASACPVGCIRMVVDAEGFPYPEVDSDVCVGCGRCERVCPFLNASGEAPVKAALAARTRDEGLLMQSSSGGVFTELCRPILDDGGVVYGVAMDADCRGCSFVRAESVEDVAPMRGSKYLQADSRGIYERVAEDLRSGRRVLFSGTPCQANALSLYLGGRRDGLLLVDFVCHGVPSPRLWSESVAQLEAESGARVGSVDFRCKEVSWRRFGLRAELGGRAVFQPLGESPYLRMFLRDVCLRESCYACEAKASRSADVTIADFWGIEKVVPGMSDELGCSLVVARTPVGEDVLGRIGRALETREVPYEEAVRENSAIGKSVRRPAERDGFYSDLDALGYAGVVRKYGEASFGEGARRLARGVLTRLGLLEAARKLIGGRLSEN